MENTRLKIVDVTFSSDTLIYAANDLIADTQVITDAFFDKNRPGVIESVHLIDEDDNTAVPLILYFLDDSGSLGTENAGLTPTDAVARTIIGSVSFLAADFKDYINSKGAFKSNLGIVVKPKTDTRDLYVALALDGAGTPTYTATGLKARIAIRS